METQLRVTLRVTQAVNHLLPPLIISFYHREYSKIFSEYSSQATTDSALPEQRQSSITQHNSSTASNAGIKHTSIWRSLEVERYSFTRAVRVWRTLPTGREVDTTSSVLADDLLSDLVQNAASLRERKMINCSRGYNVDTFERDRLRGRISSLQQQETLRPSAYSYGSGNEEIPSIGLYPPPHVPGRITQPGAYISEIGKVMSQHASSRQEDERIRNVTRNSSSKTSRHPFSSMLTTRELAGGLDNQQTVLLPTRMTTTDEMVQIPARSRSRSPTDLSETFTSPAHAGRLHNRQILGVFQQSATRGGFHAGLQRSTRFRSQSPASLPATSDIPAHHKTIQIGGHSVVETGSSARLPVTTGNFSVDNQFSQAAASLISPNIHATGHLSRSPSRDLPQKSDSRPSMRVGSKGLMPIMEDPRAESVVTAGQRRGTPFRSVDQVSSKADVRAQYGSNSDGPAPEGRVADTEWNSYDDDDDDDGDGGDNATILKEFELIDSSFQAVAKCLNISLGDVLARYDTYRLDSEEEQLAYKLYEGYYSEHVMEESSRVPAATNDNESNDTDHICNCWRQFRRTHPMTWPSIIKLEDRMSDIAIDGNAPQEREHLSNYFTQKLTSLLNALAENHGLHSVLIMAGNNIVKDGGIGMAYESSESEGFLCKLTHASTDEAIGHLKAHVWHNHSTACLEKIYAHRILHGAPEPGFDQLPAEAPANAGEQADFDEPVVDDFPVNLDTLLSQIKENIKILLRDHQITYTKKFPWVTLLRLLAENHLVCENWPEKVHYPGQWGTSKGIQELNGDERQTLWRALTQGAEERRVRIRKRELHEVHGVDEVLVMLGESPSGPGERGLRVFISLPGFQTKVDWLGLQNGQLRNDSEQERSDMRKRKLDIDDVPIKRVRYSVVSQGGVQHEILPSDDIDEDGVSSECNELPTDDIQLDEAGVANVIQSSLALSNASSKAKALDSEVEFTHSEGKRRQIDEGSDMTSGPGSFEARAKHEAGEHTRSARKRRQVDEGSHTMSGETRAYHNVGTLLTHVQPPTPAKPLAAVSSGLSKSVTSQQSIGASHGAAIMERAPSGSTQSAGRDAQAIQEDVKDRNDSSELSRPSYAHPIGSVHHGTEHYADDWDGRHGILGTSTGNIISTPHMPVTTAGHAEAAVPLPDNSHHDTVFNMGTPYANVTAPTQLELGRSYVRYPQEVLDLAEQVWVLRNMGVLATAARGTRPEHESSGGIVPEGTFSSEYNAFLSRLPEEPLQKDLELDSLFQF
ncbi:uncharacterized protein LAESUDRAFT_715985 [Laetiporus sulphureus 93-53]|uniref:Uncharacterized protein n=1 Tax=Laetiporus sulphureus 93-53 TaxID=1314785 RepID=A0A165CZT6_9APHY|nr:uncharacterized protein LAESUDRAFT_715985 [Laetiporus sulphureus 93-53]KZT03844.1 hypothetical protein LAESUDRAFT_715985 [Laetiporus sulphureus 93-53]